jgi:hypothetical protein
MSEHPADSASSRVTITPHAYASLAGVAVDDGPTIRAGLARKLGSLASEYDLDGLEADWRTVAAAALPKGWQVEGEAITAPGGSDQATGLRAGARIAATSAPHNWHVVLDLEAGQAHISTPWRAREGWAPVAELPIPTGDAVNALEALDETLARPVPGPTGHRAHWERTGSWDGAGHLGIARLRRVAD